MLYGMLFFRVQGRGKLPGLLLAFDGSFDRPLLYREGPEGTGGEPVALGAADAEEEGPADDMVCLGECAVVAAAGGLGHGTAWEGEGWGSGLGRKNRIQAFGDCTVQCTEQGNMVCLRRFGARGRQQGTWTAFITRYAGKPHLLPGPRSGFAKHEVPGIGGAGMRPASLAEVAAHFRSVLTPAAGGNGKAGGPIVYVTITCDKSKGWMSYEVRPRHGLPTHVANTSRAWTLCFLPVQPRAQRAQRGNTHWSSYVSLRTPYLSRRQSVAQVDSKPLLYQHGNSHRMPPVSTGPAQLRGHRRLSMTPSLITTHAPDCPGGLARPRQATAAPAPTALDS